MQEFKYEKIGKTSYQMNLDNDFKVIVAPTESKDVTVAINVSKGSYLQKNLKIGTQVIRMGTASFLQHCLIKNHPSEADALFVPEVKNISDIYESYTTYAFNTTSDKYLELIDPLISLVNKFNLDNDKVEAAKKDYFEIAFKEEDKSYLKDRKALFLDSPLKENLFGDEKNIKAIHFTALKKFFTEYYRTGNLTLIVTGDVDQAKIEEIVRNHKFEQPLGKREQVTFTPTNENYDALNNMRVLKSEGDKIVTLNIKFQKRESLVKTFDGYLFPMYFMIKDFLFSLDNTKFTTTCKNLDEVVSCHVYEANEETYLNVKFKAVDEFKFIEELENYLSLGKKMISYKEFYRLRKSGYLRLKEELADSQLYFENIANALANSYFYLTVLNLGSKLQGSRVRKFAGLLGIYQKVIY